MSQAFLDPKLAAKLSALHTGSLPNPTSTTPVSPEQKQLHKELWEKERKKIIQNASNNQGEGVEKIMAKYLAL